ncbi:MAG: hypothetical protein VX871_08030 [Pseudomonadota bacterium]|nr:hypothetical protein [Pseudomonadota bacterium]
MDMQQIHEYARRLVEVHGDKAELEAAARQKAAESSGDQAEASRWKRIRASVRERRGATVS